MSLLRVGQGWDRHRLVKGRPLLLGGVSVASDLGEDGHSDGDLLLHAITDAVLGALALGDIGRFFPPSEAEWKDAPSRIFLEKALALANEAGYRVVNIDSTIVLQKPRLAPYIDAIQSSLEEMAGLPKGSVSLKAKTAEGLDACGRLEAIEAQAIVLMEKAE